MAPSIPCRMILDAVNIIPSLGFSELSSNTGTTWHSSQLDNSKHGPPPLR